MDNINDTDECRICGTERKSHKKKGHLFLRERNCGKCGIEKAKHINKRHNFKGKKYRG